VDTNKDRKLLAVVFTDIEGFSALTQKDEQKALKHVARYRQIVTELTEKYHGSIINFYGDGSLTTHESVLDAVKCTIEMQASLALEPQIPVRIGIHLGEAVISDETIYGNAVNLASRIQNLGKAQSILISGTVAGEMRNHPSIKTVLIGSEYVKNIKEKVDVYAITNDNLVIPTKKEIHDKSKGRKKSTYIIFAIIIIALIASILLDFFPFNDPPLREQRILILPFVNETGDSSLNEFSIYASSFINSLMMDVDDIKLVALNNLIVGDEYKKFGISPFTPYLKMTNADNFISGKFRLKNDSTYEVSCELVDGKSGKYIKQFPDQLVDLSNTSPGLIQLSERIIGFIISEEYHPASIPNKDAFSAYLQALRVWRINEYRDSRRYLKRAIGYDSTFLDAYHLLLDTYSNTLDFETADSIFNVIKNRFRIETQTESQKNQSYYYNAFYDGNYKAAYGYLGNIYNEDKEDIFNNTSMASIALYYINAPKETIKILKKIPFTKISYELQDNRSRITMGIQAYYATKKYKTAVELAGLYPSRGMSLLQRNMRLRAFAGIKDTIAINNELAAIKLTTRLSGYQEALFWTAQQFSLQKNDVNSEKYMRLAYSSVVGDSVITQSKTEILYGVGKYQDGLVHAIKLFRTDPDVALHAYRVGWGYALIGRQDSAKVYLSKIRAIKPKYDKGNSDYLEALLLTTLGDYDSAMVKLQSAIDHGFIFYEYTMEFDPRLMPLFDKPEFQKIIHPLAN